MAQRELRCPACDAPMQSVDRRGVTIDICRDCRGVFLDRGELDTLLDLAAHAEETAAAAAPQSAPPSEYRRPDEDDFEHWRRSRRHDKRRRGFFDDFFD